MRRLALRRPPADRLTSLGNQLAAFGNRTALLTVFAGLVIIGLGYLGASHGSVAGTVDLRAQLPYLLSGGFLGLGVVVLGGALLVSQSARQDAARLERALERLAQAPPSSATLDPATTGRIPTNAAELVAAGSASYHIPTCRLVQGRDQTRYLTPGEARGQGLKACRICKPDELAVSAS